ncbi:MAG: hypothetical protein LBS21_01525 [Clostridiales bacterium]|jgi:hypothetical protein|nr:hypothetical protein [Clostridiales bacterium]
MTQRQLKEKLYRLAETYFRGATIVWGKVKKVKPNSPLIVLTAGSVVSTYQSITETAKGIPVTCKPSKTTLQVDLYTKGETISDGGFLITENTAVNDLAEFLNFLDSPFVEDWRTENDVSIITGQVKDLTTLVNESSWEFRAMTELEIGFTQFSSGYTGTNYENGLETDENGNQTEKPFNPTPSGGGSQELADGFTGWFEQVETEYVKE